MVVCTYSESPQILICLFYASRHAVYWELTNYYYLGHVIGIAYIETVTMAFLHQTSPNANKLKITNNVDSVTVSDFVLRVDAPTPISSSRCSTIKLGEKDCRNKEKLFGF